MRKKVFGRKLSRSRPAREALFASLIRSMILNGKLVTTKAKAKAIQGQLDRFVSLSKTGNLEARRKVLAYLDNAKDATSVLFDKVSVAFKDRSSGFTRIINLSPRKGDNSPQVRLEWTDPVDLTVKKVEKVVKAKKSEKTTKKKVEKKVSKKK